MSVRLPQEDFQWLAGFARREDVSEAALTRHAIWLLRLWEETMKDTITEVLDGIDALCRDHDQELTQLRHDYEWRLMRQARTERPAMYGAKTAKLLDLAMSTNSDSEASAAFAKARALHHPTALANSRSCATCAPPWGNVADPALAIAAATPTRRGPQSAPGSRSGPAAVRPQVARLSGRMSAARSFRP
jgi:hypothetical protein